MLARKNTLAYYGNFKVTTVKSFIKLAFLFVGDIPEIQSSFAASQKDFFVDVLSVGVVSVVPNVVVGRSSDDCRYFLKPLELWGRIGRSLALERHLTAGILETML